MTISPSDRLARAGYRIPGPPRAIRGVPRFIAMRPRTAGALLAALVGLTLAFPAARAASPGHVPPPLPPVAGEGRPRPAAAARGLAAQRQLHDRGPPRPGEAHDRRHAGPRVAQHERPGALRRSRSTSTGTPSATTSRRPRAARAAAPRATASARSARFGWTQVKSVRAPRRRRAGRHDSRPDPHDPLPERGRQHRRPHGDGGADGAADRPGRDAPLPRSSGTRSCPTAASAARAGCTTTTSSRSGSPRSASSGRAGGTATRSTPGRSSSPTSASTT